MFLCPRRFQGCKKIQNLNAGSTENQRYLEKKVPNKYMLWSRRYDHTDRKESKFEGRTISRRFERRSFTLSFADLYHAFVQGNYKYDEQISFWGGVYGQGPRSAYIVNKLASINRTLPAFVDINLGGQFNFNKSFGLYLEFKNILNKQYEQVNLYPVRGFQVLFGAKVKIF